MHNSNSRSEQLRRLVAAAMFSALAYVLMIVFHIKVQFLTFDAKDAVLTVGGMFLGPLYAAGMSLLVAFLEMVTVSSTGYYGFIMNFVSSAVFSVVAALIYKYRRKLSGAILGIGISIVAMPAAMICANLLVTPGYMHAPVSAVVGLIVPLLLPFNFTKAVLNAALVLLLYKPASRALRASGLIRKAPASGTEAPKKSAAIVVAVIAALLLVASLLVFFLVLHGDFELVKEIA